LKTLAKALVCLGGMALGAWLISAGFLEEGKEVLVASGVVAAFMMFE